MLGDFLDRYESSRETTVAEEDDRVAGRPGSVGRTPRVERSPVGRVQGRGNALRAQGKYIAFKYSNVGGGRLCILYIMLSSTLCNRIKNKWGRNS